MIDYLIGVDGGGSGTRVRLARADGSELAQGQNGPSGLAHGIDQAWIAVGNAVLKAFAAAGIAHPPLRHIGIYGYRVGFLRQFPTLAQAPFEITESLEQLRALWHGHQIAVHICQHAPGPGVDTLEDLERVRHLYATKAPLA